MTKLTPLEVDHTATAIDTPGVGVSARATVALGLFLICAAVGAQVRQREFRGYSPEILAQGGSYTAIARGYESLFTNPAGISAGEPEFRASHLGVWFTARPDKLIATTRSLVTDQSAGLSGLTEQFTKNGVGLGASWGLGFTGKRVGAALEFDSDVYLFGKTFPAGLEGVENLQLTGSVGYSHPFLIGPLRLDAGLALRPFVRQFAVIDPNTAVSLLGQFTKVDTGDEVKGKSFESLPVLSGFGVGIDTGVIAELGAFRLALQLRNLFDTRVDYAQNTFSDFLANAGEGRLPQSDTTVRHAIPIEFSFGAAWGPDLGKAAEIIDPVVHFEVRDPFFNTDPDKSRPTSFWTRVHIGSEIELLRFFDLRLGLNQGYLTYGAGIDVRAFQFAFALYTLELGRSVGAQPVSGVAFAVTIP